MTKCNICNYEFDDYLKNKLINDRLRKQWGISKDLQERFNKREGYSCPNCFACVRAMHLAKSINRYFGVKSDNFEDFIKFSNDNKLKIAEVNACHALHNQLRLVKDIKYSEYLESDIDSIDKKIATVEDICNLTYPDNSFDLVLHSETLEHVPDPEKAVSECRRILKRNGVCIFTIPIVLDRPTKQRAKLKGDKMEYILKPSFHGDDRDDCLVWWEFGRDIFKTLDVQLKYFDMVDQNMVIVCKKKKSRNIPNELFARFLQQYYSLLRWRL